MSAAPVQTPAPQTPGEAQLQQQVIVENLIEQYDTFVEEETRRKQGRPRKHAIDNELKNAFRKRKRKKAQVEDRAKAIRNAIAENPHRKGERVAATGGYGSAKTQQLVDINRDKTLEGGVKGGRRGKHAGYGPAAWDQSEDGQSSLLSPAPRFDFPANTSLVRYAICGGLVPHQSKGGNIL